MRSSGRIWWPSHSLGEFSALVAAGALSFEEGLRLVSKRAHAMQKACEARPSTMAAVLALPDEKVEEVCAGIDETVAPANYNCPGQVVISGTVEGIDKACEKLLEAGAKRAMKLKVGGAFHSPLMQLKHTKNLPRPFLRRISRCRCVLCIRTWTANPTLIREEIKANLIKQLTAPVRWTYDVQAMIADGADEFVELGPGNVLPGSGEED